MVDRGYGNFRELLRETVRKVLNTGQTPHHKATHRHLDERFCALRQTLVVFAHPSVLPQPRKGPLYPTHLRGKNALEPSGGSSFLGSIETPSLAHSLAHLIITASGT